MCEFRVTVKEDSGIRKAWWTDVKLRLWNHFHVSWLHQEAAHITSPWLISLIQEAAQTSSPWLRPLCGWFRAIFSDALQPLRWQQEPDSSSCSPLQGTRQIPPLNTRLGEIWPPFTSEDLSDELASSPVKPSARPGSHPNPWWESVVGVGGRRRGQTAHPQSFAGF